MSKYIDAEKLIAEIERLKEKYNKSVPVNVSNDRMEATKALVCMGKVEVLNQALCVLHSLQQEQPEVDIEKEIDKLWKGLNTGHEYVIVDSYQDFLGICLHCFELGLNARKED